MIADKENISVNANTNNEVCGDSYLVKVHDFPKGMRKQAKKVEQESKLLDDRLHCLKDEGKKSLKMVVITPRKTPSKLNSLQQKEQIVKKKMDFKDQNKHEIEIKKKSTQPMMIPNVMSLLMLGEDFSKTREEDIKILNEQKKINEELKKCLNTEDISNMKTQADYIKNEQMLAEENRKMVEREKQDSVKMEHDRKNLEEHKTIIYSEIKNSKYEEKETEIMKKIKTTSEMNNELSENYSKSGCNNSSS